LTSSGQGNRLAVYLRIEHLTTAEVETGLVDSEAASPPDKSIGELLDMARVTSEP
jgi:hypothetical protein